MFDNIYNNVTIITNQNCLNNYKKIFKKIENNFYVEEV